MPRLEVAPFRLFTTLLAAYGPQRWWPAKSAFGMMSGAILVQNTAWTQAARAVDALEAAGLLSPRAIREVAEERLWEEIRPAGYFRVKGRRLKALATFLQSYGDRPENLFQLPTAPLREALLSVYGVGKESADSMINYGAARPVFVVDAYTRRLFSRLTWVGEKAGYDEVQTLVHDRFPADAAQLAEFHALIVRHAKRHCRVRPLCAGCPVAGCPYPERMPP